MAAANPAGTDPLNTHLKATATVTVKPPGRLATYTRRKARAAAPYAAGLIISGILAAILRSMMLFGVAVGVTATLITGRLLEERGIRRAGGRRAARQRRKYQHEATRWDIHKHLSAGAARRKARFTRPQTTGRLAPHEAGVHVGTAHGRRLHITWEDSALLLGIRAGKSAFFGDAIWDAPGAVAAFSVFPDLHNHTAVRRGETGRLWALNPGGYGNLPTNFAWSPLDGCHTARGALQRRRVPDGRRPPGRSQRRLLDAAGPRLAAPVHARRDPRWRCHPRGPGWVADPSDLDALTILDNHPMTGAPDGLTNSPRSSSWTTGPTRENSIQSTALSALALARPTRPWPLSPPPPRTGGSTLRQFIEDGTGTLYVIGDDNPHNPLTPYLSCLNGHLFETAIRLGSASPGGRLDPPFMLACDELALTKPPLHRWSSMAGGRGVTLLAGTQSPSQLEACWDKAGGDTVFDNMSVVVFGGLKVAENLEKISRGGR